MPAGDVITEALEENTAVLKQFVEGAMNDMADECEKNSQATERVESNLTKLANDFGAFKFATNNSLQNQANNTSGHLNTMHTTFREAIEDLKGRLTGLENRAEGLTIAVKHCDDKLSSWSTRDFYEHVANLLALRNPNWLATGSQIQNLTTQYQSISAQTQNLVQQHQALYKHVQTLVAQQRNSNSTTTRINGSVNGNSTPASELDNGNALRALPANVDPEAIAAITRQISALATSQRQARAEVETLWKRLDEHMRHMDEHTRDFRQRMSDIREWTQGVSREMASQHEVTAAHKEEIAALRGHLRRQHSGSPGSLASPSALVLGDCSRREMGGELWPLGVGEVKAGNDKDA
jgi:prefoldin subunit 5